MSRPDEARQAILRSIRAKLAASAPHDALHVEAAPAHPATRGGSIPLPVLPPVVRTPEPQLQGAPAAPLPPLARFRERLEAAAGHVLTARGEAEAAEVVAGLLARLGARRVAVSDAPLVRAVAERLRGRDAVELAEGSGAAELFRCDAGLTSAQYGIAETGTLALESSRERHRLASLIPPVHVVLLPADRVRASLGEVLAAVREGAPAGEVPSRAITLITGPSRTSDIELTLAIGVHGPKELYVVVVEALA